MLPMIAGGTPPRVSRRGALTPRCASVAEGVPPGRHQRLLAPLDERRLLVAADLHEGQVGEAGVGVLLRRLEHGVDVVPAGNALGDVLLADELAGRVEGRRPGQLGVDLPAEAEPPEQGVRPGDRPALVGAEADRYLADPGLAGTTGRVEHL